jgi:GTP-binding protein YchF
MSLQIGIVGLPNVGKSTLFNALTRSKGAQAENYPFCTIDPNVGIVEVPDSRLYKIAEIVDPKEVIPAVCEFVDIAGLVKGAAEGEGLGNKFLANIRECDAILQVVRCFEDSNIHHVTGEINPKDDIETINTELILADIQTVDKAIERLSKEVKAGDKKIKAELAFVQKVKEWLDEGNIVSTMDIPDEYKEAMKELHLLTSKPFLYASNLSEDQIVNVDMNKIREMMGVSEKAKVVPMSAKIEEDLQELSEAEVREYLNEMGLEESTLNQLIRDAYDVLGLQTFFTAGPKEARAWTVKKGATAPQAAGVIHTDFEKGFIRAEIVSYEDFIECNGEAGAREKGKLRSEGKEYVIKDGDVCHFLFNT